MYPSTAKGLLADAALELGLDYVPSVLESGRDSPVGRVSGALLTLERRMVGSIGRIRVHVVESRSHTRLYLMYGAAYPPAGVPVRLRRETILRRLAGLLPSLGDTRVGAPSFDDLVWVRGGDASEAAAYLTAARREAIIRLISGVPDVRIDDGRIDGSERWSRFRPPETSHIVATVGLFVEAAERLAG